MIEKVSINSIKKLMDIDDILNPSLPRKLDTLKSNLRQQLPMLKLMRKKITVIIKKQPSLSSRDKELERTIREVYIYWYDPFDLIYRILNAELLQSKMFFGMAQYSDNPTELWHSRVWGSSIRSTSGHYAYSRDGDLLIAGDIVRFEVIFEGLKRGRIIFIGQDYRSTATRADGPIIITIQSLLNI